MSGFEDKIRGADQIDYSNEGLLWLITGAPGSGKTTWIASIADVPEYSGKVMVLSYHGGMSAIRDRNDVAVVNAIKWADIKDAREYVAKSGRFKFLCIDLISEAYLQRLREWRDQGMSTKTGNRATLEARGVVNDEFVDMVRDMRMLAETKGIHVVFTTHTAESKDDDSGVILIRPNLTPGTLSTVLGIVDVAIYLDKRKDTRVAYLAQTSRIWAKVKKPLSYGPVKEILENPTYLAVAKEMEPNQ